MKIHELVVLFQRSFFTLSLTLFFNFRPIQLPNVLEGWLRFKFVRLINRWVYNIENVNIFITVGAYFSASEFNFSTLYSLCLMLQIYVWNGFEIRKQWGRWKCRYITIYMYTLALVNQPNDFNLMCRCVTYDKSKFRTKLEK